MKTAGNAICTAAELTACVKYGVYDFNSRDIKFGMVTYGDTGTVILYGCGSVLVDGHIDGIATSRKSLVD